MPRWILRIRKFTEYPKNLLIKNLMHSLQLLIACATTKLTHALFSLLGSDLHRERHNAITRYNQSEIQKIYQIIVSDIQLNDFWSTIGFDSSHKKLYILQHGWASIGQCFVVKSLLYLKNKSQQFGWLTSNDLCEGNN